MSHLKHVFAFLRGWHFISPYFKTWDGRYGFIFEPHDARRSLQHGVCIKHAQMDPYGALGEPPDGTRRSTVVAPLVAPQVDFRSTARSTPRSTDDSSKPTDCEELTDEQVAKWMTENAQDYSSKVLRLEGLKVKGLESKKVDQAKIDEQQQEQKPDQQQARSLSFESKPGTVEATATPKDRKRPVLAPGEYADARDRADVERRLAEIKERVAAIPTCPLCRCRHVAGEKCFDVEALRTPSRGSKRV